MAFLKIRADDGELEQWKANAVAGGLSLSEWVRLMLNRVEPAVVPDELCEADIRSKSPFSSISKPPVSRRAHIERQIEGVSKKRMCQHGFFYLADGSLNCPRCA